MIILDTTNRSIQFKLGGAVTTAELPWFASYMNDTGSDFLLVANQGISNGTTPVTLVPAPVGTDRHQVKFLQIRQADTATANFIFEYKDGATVRNTMNVMLDPGDVLQFTDGEGWRTVNNLGAIKTTFITQFLPHATTHENGGTDEISVAGLSGALADPQTPTTHATSHQNGGSDEISVAGLSGLLADPQTPLAHATSHQNGGADEISVAGLSGLLADDQTPLTHNIITKHNGFPGGGTTFLRDDGTFAVPPGTGAGITELTGDVTAGPGSGSQVATIPNDTVTYAKMQNISATDRLLGRDTSGAGDTEELTVTGGVEFTGLGGIQRSALTGDVTATAGSNATTIANNAVTDAKLRDSAGFSVIGKATTGSGDPADIVAADETVLGRTAAGNLTFAQLATGQIANDAVTFAKFQNITSDRLLGRDTAASGDVEEISLDTTLEFTGAQAIRRAALTGDVTATAGSNATVLSSTLKVVEICFIVDGGGSAITTGQKGHVKIPFACTINQADLYADQTGSVVVDIWKDTYANFPPTVADTITAAAKPTLSATQKYQDATLTGWTTSIAAGDILAYNIDSVATITRLTITLKATRT